MELEPEQANKLFLLMSLAVLFFSAVIGSFMGLVFRFVLRKSKLTSVYVGVGSTIVVTAAIFVGWGSIP